MVVVLLLAACGRSPGLPADEGFRQIQVHEAALTEASAKLEDSAECASAEPLSAKVCSESQALCRVATELADDDALSRCRNSLHACEGARERAARCCATSAPP